MKSTLITIATLALAICVNAQTRNRISPPTAKPTAYSFASNTEHEVVLSPSLISIETYKEGESRTDVNAYFAYNRHFKDNVQLGGEGGILSYPDSDGSGNKALFAAIGVFTYNFQTNLRDAFFAQGGLGLYPAYEDNDGFESKLSFFAGLGKRFEMWGKINYMPYARVWKRGDENTRFEIQALNFSIFY